MPGTGELQDHQCPPVRSPRPFPERWVRLEMNTAPSQGSSLRTRDKSLLLDPSSSMALGGHSIPGPSDNERE